MKPHPATQAHTARQAGYSLVEIGVAVAIVAMLVLVALTGVQNILTANKISQQVRNVARLTSKINALYATGTSGVTQLEVVQAGGWSSDFATISGNTATIKSAWGTGETIAPNQYDAGTMGANRGFIYTIHNVPKDACIDLGKGLDNLVFSMAIWQGATTAAGMTDTHTAFSATEFLNTANSKPAGSALSTKVMAGQCNQSGDTFDFIVTIKP